VLVFWRAVDEQIPGALHGLAWAWSRRPRALERLCVPIAGSADELLEASRRRIGQASGAGHYGRLLGEDVTCPIVAPRSRPYTSARWRPTHEHSR
jgi:hypothetical protein